MNKRILTLVAFLFISASTFAQNGKVGYVNVEGVLNSMPSYQAAMTQIGNYAESIVPQEIKTKTDAYETRRAKFEQEAANMSETNQEVEFQELVRMEKEIGQMHQQNQTQEKIVQKQNELLGPVQLEAQNLINEIAKENGFSIVFNMNGQIIYAEDGANLMPLVKQKLGAN